MKKPNQTAWTLSNFAVSILLILILPSHSFVSSLQNSSLINTTNIINNTKEDGKFTTEVIIDMSASKIPCDDKKDKNNNCSLADGLVCSKDGFCKCAYPNLIYNEEKSTCFAKVGQQCGFYIGLKNASIVSCPENSVCALINLEIETDGQNNAYSVHQCACIYTHYQNDQGNCVLLAKHGENCDDKKRKCTPESDLVCLNASCQCPFKNDQYFDNELEKCVSFAGGNCTRNCVPDSVCDFYGSGTCQCRLDHKINKETRRCERIPPGYLSPCLGETELCNAEMGLKCIDKVCQCKNPLHQLYDYQQEKCIGMVGDFCNMEEGPGNCVQDAECVRKNETTNTHVCKCSSGFSTTPYRKCMKSYSYSCSNEFCNVYRGLSCINGSCQCYDSFLKYDSISESCLSSLGSPCGKIFAPGFPGDLMKMSCPECDSYYFACENKLRCTRDFSQGTEIGTLEKFRCQTTTATPTKSTVGNV